MARDKAVYQLIYIYIHTELIKRLIVHSSTYPS